MTNNASKHTGVCQSTNQNPSNQTLPVPDTVFSNQEIRHELSKTGLNGLVFDHSSFPCITLQQKSFIMSDDANFNPTTFEVTVLQTTEKHILVDSKDVNFTEVKYSRDGVSTTDGELLQVYIDAMVKDGRAPVVKRYLDVLVQLHTKDKHNGKLAVLSISPTSVSRISGFFYQLRLQGKLDVLSDLLITVSKGQQRTSKNGQSYMLWQFDLAEQEAVEVAA